MAKGDVGSVWLGPLGALMSGQDPLSPAKEPRELGRYEWGWPQDPRAQPPTPHNIPGFPQDVPVHGVRAYRQGGGERAGRHPDHLLPTLSQCLVLCLP